MDLLHKRYASPFSLLDLMIQSYRFCDFIDEMIETNEEEKLWQMYLSMLSNPMYEVKQSFNEFKKSVLNPKPKEEKMTEKEIEATVIHSKDIFNSFDPYKKGGDG